MLLIVSMPKIKPVITEVVCMMTGATMQAEVVEANSEGLTADIRKNGEHFATLKISTNLENADLIDILTGLKFSQVIYNSTLKILFQKLLIKISQL